MDDKNRTTVIKIRLNDAELQAIIKLANGHGLAATFRELLHEKAPR